MYTTKVYYNENDPKAAAWLRELIREKLIASGEVDERSIEDVRPSDLVGFAQCHFFAGVGGWSYALRLAGWPDDRPVWTGSCPCQPFSAAGKRAGTADERHLWPAWQWLIGQSRPRVIFGEQVASKDGISWLDLVSTDLEAEGYAFAPIVLPACSVGAPHIRQRLWFVANDARDRRFQRGAESIGRGSIGGGVVVEPSSARSLSGTPAGIHCAEESTGTRDGKLERSSPIVELEHADHRRPAEQKSGPSVSKSGQVNGFWGDAIWIRCSDGKQRPTKPGIFPLAHGVSGRVAKLRGIGNAIVPQVAAEVIAAYGV